jgi:hypothetical protein
MIRLLELQTLKIQPNYKRLNYKRLNSTRLNYERRKVDTGLGHGSTIRNVSDPEIHLREIMKCATAYLRVAHIYMLISMPTDTSTIFGAFQAIRLSLCYRANSTLAG